MFGSIRTAIIAASAPNSWTDAQQQDTSPWGYHSSIIVFTAMMLYYNIYILLSSIFLPEYQFRH